MAPVRALGIDVETVEPREIDWCEDYFVTREMDAVRASGGLRDRVVATIWSAKESVVKALGVGLRMDLREIEVRGPIDWSSSWTSANDWVALDVQSKYLAKSGNVVSAYAMQADPYVLTAVVISGPQAP
jgi:phosphopantetheinyl transferase